MSSSTPPLAHPRQVGDRQTDEQAGGAAEQLHVVQITLSIINHDKKTTATAMNATKDESEMCVDHYS
jgi:hypothetical protein